MEEALAEHTRVCGGRTTEQNMEVSTADRFEFNGETELDFTPYTYGEIVSFLS